MSVVIAAIRHEVLTVRPPLHVGDVGAWPMRRDGRDRPLRAAEAAIGHRDSNGTIGCY